MGNSAVFSSAPHFQVVGSLKNFHFARMLAGFEQSCKRAELLDPNPKVYARTRCETEFEL